VLDHRPFSIAVARLGCGDGGKARTRAVHFGGRFSFPLPAGHIYIYRFINVAPQSPLLKTCWSSRAEPVWEIWPLAAETFAPDRPRGLRPSAAAATPAVFGMQRIGCQSWGPLCWLPGVRGSDSTAALGPHRVSRWCELRRSLVHMFRRPWMAWSFGKAAVAASLHPFLLTR
jgi:hypothetical protein